MEETKALKEVENSLRDFITIVMTEEKGEEWVDSCGISPDRIIQWKERREIEKKKQKFGTPENRLLYFSDFYDLSNIINKNWNDTFKNALGEKKTVLLFLKILDDFRNPDAHRRELLPHQKHLIIGISGEIRNRIVLYRSKKETGEDYFPRIESVRDNLGNLWTPGSNVIETNLVLRPGDEITFIITATDPLGESMEYCCLGDTDWGNSNTFNIVIDKKHIAKEKGFLLCVRSKREYHAEHGMDDKVLFRYVILPKK
jgi:hypothetical protein